EDHRAIGGRLAAAKRWSRAGSRATPALVERLAAASLERRLSITIGHGLRAGSWAKIGGQGW
ncbi:MAG TPA: hypothetical protein VKZ79_10300, partial [Alphaproteobacteria bacterium]|nr:hypothetical protein [Alphaproteobacteria bacterium]